MSDDHHDAKNTLRRVAEQLLAIANNGCSQPVNTSNNINSASTSTSLNRISSLTSDSPPCAQPPGQGMVSPLPLVQTTAAVEHRRVFNYMRRGSASSKFTPVSSTRQSAARGKAKKKGHTCTLKFFCLGNVDDAKPPSTVARKANLSNCGLGPGTITIDMSESIHVRLVEKFPPLSVAGGYELLLFQRGGEEIGFHKLPTPYSIHPGKIKGDSWAIPNIYQAFAEKP